jgi:hypothetical protein
MCTRAPEGWICHLPEDHDGPCPAYNIEGPAQWITDWNGEWPDAERIAYDIEHVLRLKIAQEIRTYAEETHPPHAAYFGCPRCDVTAALRVAANRVERTR